MHKRLLYRLGIGVAFLFALVLQAQPAFADNVYFTSTPVYFVTAGQTYTYSVKVTSVLGYPVTYSFPSLPEWLHFNTGTATLYGMTTTTGTYTIGLTASDNHGSTASQWYNLYVTAPKSTPTPTQKPTATPVPTNTAPTPSSNITPSVTITATPSPSTTPTPTTASNKVTLSHIQPGNNATITNASPAISGTLTTPFALNKTNFSIFFDNIDVTAKTQLATKQTGASYETVFTYQASKLSSGKHTVNITLTNPDGIIIPESWSFNVATGSTPSMTFNNIGNALDNFFTTQRTAIVVLGLALLALIIIVGRVLNRKATLSEEQKRTKR